MLMPLVHHLVAVLDLILVTIWVWAIYRGFRSPNHKPKRTR